MSALLGPILRFFIKIAGKKALPRIDGKIDVKGLGAPVEVIRDKWGIPHIYANDDNDAVFAQGYVHAQDRLWQMELHRRIASGRLSEMIGKDALDTDRATRTFGFYRLACETVALMDEDIKGLLEAYASGVNAFLHGAKNLPPEFGLIKVKPEPWTIIDTMAFGQFMAWQLSGQWKMKVPRLKVLKAIGKDKLDELDPEYPAANPSVVPEGVDVNALDESSMVQATKNGPHVRRGGGSNSWAIAGSRTRSGMPLHCSDPHLAPSLPSIWYACHLTGNEINLTGVSPPGVPLALIGHNARFAWGLTVANVDAEDLFIEKINPDNPAQYLYMDEWRDAEIIEETIRISKQSPHVEKIMKTVHGPIISDAVGISGQAISLCSKCLQPMTAFKGFITLARGKSWDDFVVAIKNINSLQQNATYADVDGNIGSYITGNIPIRKSGDGSVPMPGWTGEFDWDGEIPFDEKPHCFNPEKGFVVCANNRPVDVDNYPHFLSKVWDPGYRANRISATIATNDKFTIDDCKRLHVDTRSLPGEEFVKLLDGIESDDMDVALALKLLKEWDYNLAVDSVGGAVYDLARHFSLCALVEAGLEKTLASEILYNGFDPVLASCTELFHADITILFKLLGNPDSWWVKQAGGKEAVLKKGLKQAVEWLRANVSKDAANWQWGKVNMITFPHAFAMKKPMDKVFNVGPCPMPGNKHTVLQAGNAGDEPWGQKIWVPSYRHIVDLSDLSKAKFVYAPGQSGNLASPHYRDLFDLWLTGKYIPMLWTREQVEQNAEGKLILVP